MRSIFFLCLALIPSAYNFEIIEDIKDMILGERCVKRWMPSDITGFGMELSHSVFGQPFLKESLLPLLRRHLNDKYQPKKALVLSFHGSAGTGKTYTSQLLANFIFKNGVQSKFYHLIRLVDSFQLTKSDLRKLVINAVSKCERAVFVFDEIEKMHNGIMDAIKPFLDFHHEVDNVDFRKSIFIFISNIGMEQVNTLAFQLWNQGLEREDFDVAKFEEVLFQPSYNENGALKGTGVVRNHLIDMYVPFLPLEKKHVVKCITKEANNLHYTVNQGVIDKILNNLKFLPESIKRYAASGCKNVHPLIFRYGTPHDEL